MEGFALGKIHGEGLRRGDVGRGGFRYGGFMARARTRMVGGSSCTLRCFCSSWSAVTHDGSAMVLENEDKNEDERGR